MDILFGFAGDDFVAATLENVETTTFQDITDLLASRLGGNPDTNQLPFRLPYRCSVGKITVRVQDETSWRAVLKLIARLNETMPIIELDR